MGKAAFSNWSALRPSITAGIDSLNFAKRALRSARDPSFELNSRSRFLCPASFVRQASELASHKFAEIAFDVKRQVAGD